MKINVLQYLEKTCEKSSKKVAVIDENGEYTFGEIKNKAYCIAAQIKQKLSGLTNVPILVYLPKGKECIAAFMGIVYSHCSYTPTDVRFPFPKVQSIVSTLNPELIITDEKNAEKLIEYGISKDKILIYDRAIKSTIEFDGKLAMSEIIDTDPAYIFFTSGSSGVPKGVVITHRNIIDYIDWAIPACNINETTRMGNQSPFYFDISTQDIYACLKAEATLIIIPERFFSFPIKALEFIRDKKINYLYWVPSAFINMCSRGALNLVDITSVKQIIFGGEVMPVKYLKEWYKAIPDLKAMNVYGPTEATVNVTWYPIEQEFQDDELIPLGYPCGNTDLILLDESDSEVTLPNKKGELCVRGSSLSPGYWDDIQKTNEMYIQNPLNSHYPELIYRTGDLVHYNEKNELVFDGRKDFQIKHMGYRIELGEIESATLSLSDISQVSADYDKEKKEIVLFYSGKISENSVRSELSNLLPKYMIPTKYINIKALPLNDNGKIDRRKLREEFI